MALTIRNRLMNAIKASFEGIVSGQPQANPYHTKWEKVTRMPLGPLAKGKANALSVLEGPERKTPDVHPFTRSDLTVNLEFHLYVSADEDAAVMLNELMGEVQRRAMEDITWGGLSYDTTETGNDIEIEGELDKQVSGVVFLEIKYKHRITDPRLQA